MSYRELAEGVAPSSRNGGGGAPPTRAVEAQVFKLTSSVSQLKKLVDQLGGPKDTVDHRHRIVELNASIQALAKGVKEQLTQLHEGQGAGGLQQPLAPDQQAKARKLLQDFAAVLQDYKATQRLAQEREMASLPKPGAQQQRGGGARAAGDVESLGADASIEQQALLQAQQQRQDALMDNAIQYNEALIEERNQGIQEIARQIGEVNEMFQDLAVLINDQGLQVVTIDQQITATAERAKEGVRELVQAERSHKASRNKCLWLALIAAVVVSLLLILVFS